MIQALIRTVMRLHETSRTQCDDPVAFGVMPGSRHDAMNDLVREHPDLVIRILREQDGVELPDDGMVRVESGELNDRISKNRQADTVIMGGPPQDPWYAIVSEIETILSRKKI